MTNDQMKAMLEMFWGAEQTQERKDLAEQGWDEFNKQPVQTMTLNELGSVLAKIEGRLH